MKVFYQVNILRKTKFPKYGISTSSEVPEKYSLWPSLDDEEELPCLLVISIKMLMVHKGISSDIH